ncbi:MAG: AAA family ATPase, partial [Halobacteriota archaeon]|nr:AAA family ATPase [Halobacteriota archaeon]
SLRKKLQKLQGYDFIIMDCPPSLSMMTVNALVACQQVYSNSVRVRKWDCQRTVSLIS